MATTSLLTLNPSQRQGTFSGVQAISPAMALGEIIIRPLMNTADLQDPANSLTMNVSWRLSSADPWRLYATTTWQGDVNADPLIIEWWPTLSVNVSDVRGKDVLGELIVPTRFRVGVSIDHVTP